MAAIFKAFSMGNNGTEEPPTRDDEEEEDDEEDNENGKRGGGQGIIDLARLLYIGVTLLRWSEAEVWRMTPYKIFDAF